MYREIINWLLPLHRNLQALYIDTYILKTYLTKIKISGDKNSSLGKKPIINYCKCHFFFQLVICLLFLFMSTKLKIYLFRGKRIYGFWPSDNLVKESSEKIFLRFLLDSFNLSEQYTLHIQILFITI